MDSDTRKKPPDLAEKARIELGEDPELVLDQIQDLRDEIQKDPKLNFRTDNAFLLRFLRARKFNQKRALELIKNYYKQRINYPRLYGKLNTSALSDELAAQCQGALFQRDRNGRAIVLFNSSYHWDTSKFGFEDLTANLLLTLELLLESEDVQINGITFLVDFKGMNLSHVTHSTPLALKQMVSVTLNAFPVRYKQIHFIHQSKIFDTLFALVKPFLSKKIRSRMNFHGENMKTLHEHFHPDILPEEFGGHAGPFDNTEWNKALAEHDETIKNDLLYGFVNS